MDQATWLPLADAARVLGLSVAATRRRAKAGTVPAERRATPQGGVWWVCVSGDGVSRDDLSDDVKRQVTSSDAHLGGGQSGYVNGSPATVRAGPLLDELVILLRERERKVDELHAQLGETMAAAAMWQERAGTLADRLAVAESQLLALAAPASSLTASTAPHPAEPTLEPFTGRLRGWIAAAVAVLVIVAVVMERRW
jgi:hypothetical protein